MKKSSMQSTFLPCLGLAAAILGASSSPVLAQDFPQPVKEHELLKREVGVWDATSRFWLAPGTEPQQSKGVETCEMCGPFWLLSTYEGEFGGIKFVGKGQLGYDKETGKFVSTWIDSMVEDMLSSTGTYNAETKEMTLTGKSTDWMTGKKKTVKMITRYEGEDKKHFEIHEMTEGTTEWVKTLEIDSVLRK